MAELVRTLREGEGTTVTATCGRRRERHSKLVSPENRGLGLIIQAGRISGPPGKEDSLNI